MEEILFDILDIPNLNQLIRTVAPITVSSAVIVGDYVTTQRTSAYALRLACYVLASVVLLCQTFQFALMIGKSNTSLWFEIVWTAL